MTNFIKRFRERDVLPMTLDVPLTIDKDTLVLKVHRFAQEELNAARAAARKAAREEGADPEKMPRDEFVFIYAKCLVSFIARHIIGWSHVSNNGTPPLAFSQDIIDPLFAEMSDVEKAALGFSYLHAITSLEKKKENSETSQTEMNKDSMNTEGQSSTASS